MSTNVEAAPSNVSRKALHIALWSAQALVSAAFCAIGLMKLLTPVDELSQTIAWAGEYPIWFLRGIAVIDIAGGLGMIVPSLTRIKPNLTCIAAACSAVLQVGAIVFHVSRGESNLIGLNILLLTLIAFIYWGRSVKAVIRPR